VTYNANLLYSHCTMATQTSDTSKESKKPLKPLTSYCIFFRLEKNYLYQKVNKGGVDPSDLPPPEQRFDPDNPGIECPPLPKRYKGVILPKNFYKTTPKGYEWEGKRRQHRKRDCGLPLPKLSRTVASNWKTAKREVLDYCEFMANYGRDLSYKELASDDANVSEDGKSEQGCTVVNNSETKITAEKLHSSEPADSCREAASPYVWGIHMMEREFHGDPVPSRDAICYANQQSQENQAPRYFSTRDLSDYRRVTEQKLQRLRDQRILLQRARTAQNRDLFAPSHSSLLRSGLSSQANPQQNHLQMSLLQHQFSMESTPSRENAIPPFARQSAYQHPLQAAVSPIHPPPAEVTNVSNTDSRDVPSRLNIFCQLERQYILQRELDAPPSAIVVASNNLFDPVKEGFGAEVILPRRYKGLLIPSKFYAKCPNHKLEEVMIVKFDLPCGIKCEYDISECIKMRWRTNVDNETLEFCDTLRRRLLMETVTPSNFPINNIVGKVALSRNAKRQLKHDQEVEAGSKRHHNDESFYQVTDCDNEDSDVSTWRGDFLAPLSSHEIGKFH